MKRAEEKIFFQLLLVYRKIEKKKMEWKGTNRGRYLWSGTTIIMVNCGKNQYETEKKLYYRQRNEREKIDFRHVSLI